MFHTKTSAFKGRGYHLKRSIVEAGWRWRGGFLQKDFKVLTFALCIRYFLSLAWKWTCQFYCALKEIFFLGTFCRRMLWDAAEGHSQDKKDSRKYWVTINRFDFSLGLYQGPSGFTLIAPCRSQGRGGRRIADWTRITLLLVSMDCFSQSETRTSQKFTMECFFAFECRKTKVITTTNQREGKYLQELKVLHLIGWEWSFLDQSQSEVKQKEN